MYQFRPTQNENVVIFIGNIRSEVHNLIKSPSKLSIIYTHLITEPKISISLTQAYFLKKYA